MQHSPPGHITKDRWEALDACWVEAEMLLDLLLDRVDAHARDCEREPWCTDPMVDELLAGYDRKTLEQLMAVAARRLVDAARITRRTR